MALEGAGNRDSVTTPLLGGSEASSTQNKGKVETTKVAGLPYSKESGRSCPRPLKFPGYDKLGIQLSAFVDKVVKFIKWQVVKVKVSLSTIHKTKDLPNFEKGMFERRKATGFSTPVNDPKNAEVTAVLEKANKEPVEFNERGFKTVEFTEDGKRYQVNIFQEGAYHGPSTDVFKERSDLMLNSTLKWMDDHKDSFDAKDHAKLKEDLKKLVSQYQESLQNPEGKFNSADMSEVKRYQSELYNKASAQLAQLTRNIQATVDDKVKLQDPKASFTLNHLKQAEKDYIVANGRPIIINQYVIRDKDSGEAKTFVSMHEPGSKQTLPSTVRNRLGLANYVTTSFGEVDQEGKVSFKHHMGRHSSYPPIAVRDSAQRKAWGMLNAKQMITDRAAEELLKHPERGTEDKPLEVNVSTMMLLTAKQGDFVRNKAFGIFGKWKGQSETLQVKESLLALSVWDGQKFKVKIGNEEKWVKFESRAMNLGTNKQAARIGLDGKLPVPEFQELNNAKEVVRFNQDTLGYLKDKASNLKPSKFAQPGFDRFMANIKDLENLSKCSEGFTKSVEEFGLKEKIDEQKKIIQGILDSVKGIEGSESDIVNNKEFLTAVRELQDLEGRLNLLYTAELAKQKDVFVDSYNKRVAALVDLEKAISQETNLEVKSKLVEMHRLLKTSTQAMESYYEERYTKADTIMEFQTLFIESQQMMGKTVEYFCKSAEDRTGRVDNILQERAIYSSFRNGQIPESMDDHAQYAIDVNQYSASYQNTRENSFAAGLQINPLVNKPLGAIAKLNHSQAILAKKVFVWANKADAPPPLPRQK